MRINATQVSVQSSRSGYAYGQLAKTPLKTLEKQALVRAKTPEDIPVTARVTKGDFVFYARESWTGTRTFSLQRNDDGWKVGRATWDNRPPVVGVSKTVTVGTTAAGAEIRIDIKDHLQLFVAGAAVNHGWRLTSNEATKRLVYGATADKNKPFIDFEYVVPGDPPFDLCPNGGAVSIAKPTLTFATVEEIESLQVQIDAAADGVSPDWDSGEVFSAAGMLDLLTTSYPGLGLGASTSWRVRVKTEAEATIADALWSDWATFPRIAKPTVDITSPGAATGDRTPPVTWTAAGQVTWRAWLFNAVTGKELDDSTRVASADHEWTPEKGLKRVGATGRVRVRVWDDVDRVATPGDPVYAEDTFDFELVAIDDAPGLDQLDVSSVGGSPVQRLAWSGPVADAYRVVRDGEWIEQIDDGVGTVEFFDYTAAPLVQHEYQVLVATDDGLVSPNGPIATVVPRPAGVWLMDPETGEKILILDEDVPVSMAERAVIHEVLGDRPPVRRRSGKPPPSGTVGGVLMDSVAVDYTAQASYAAAMSFKDNGQGHVYRLVFGSWNIPVTIGDMTAAPATIDDSGQEVYSIAFAWWQTDDESPWGDR